jgi:hypothetical protein
MKSTHTASEHSKQQEPRSSLRTTTRHTHSQQHKKTYLLGKFHQVIAEGQYLLTAILETAEETNVNVMGLTTRWSELMEISGEAESQPGKSEEEET